MFHCKYFLSFDCDSLLQNSYFLSWGRECSHFSLNSIKITHQSIDSNFQLVLLLKQSLKLRTGTKVTGRTNSKLQVFKRLEEADEEDEEENRMMIFIHL